MKQMVRMTKVEHEVLEKSLNLYREIAARRSTQMYQTYRKRQNSAGNFVLVVVLIILAFAVGHFTQ